MSSSDSIYNIAIQKKARFVPLTGYDFDRRILNCHLILEALTRTKIRKIKNSKEDLSIRR